MAEDQGPGARYPGGIAPQRPAGPRGRKGTRRLHPEGFDTVQDNRVQVECVLERTGCHSERSRCHSERSGCHSERSRGIYSNRPLDPPWAGDAFIASGLTADAFLKGIQ